MNCSTPGSLSITNSWSLLILMSIESVCHPTILSSVVPFSCLQSFPASGSFQMSQFFTSGEQSIRVSTSASSEYSRLISVTDLLTLVSKFGKLSSGHGTGKGRFSFQSQRKAMPKNAQTIPQLHSSHTLKIVQARLQQYMNLQ